VSLEEELTGSGGPEALRLRDCLRSPVAGPLDEMLQNELEQRIRQAVDCLPEKAREVLILHRFQGLNYREIAEITSTPLGTVRSRLHSALGQLRKMIKDLL
jgi:RNA polymerase sigma-70 factor (ECF subfamily)